MAVLKVVGYLEIAAVAILVGLQRVVKELGSKQEVPQAIQTAVNEAGLKEEVTPLSRLK